MTGRRKPTIQQVEPHPELCAAGFRPELGGEWIDPASGEAVPLRDARYRVRLRFAVRTLAEYGWRPVDGRRIGTDGWVYVRWFVGPDGQRRGLRGALRESGLPAGLLP